MSKSEIYNKYQKVINCNCSFIYISCVCVTCMQSLQTQTGVIPINYTKKVSKNIKKKFVKKKKLCDTYYLN